MRQTSGTSRSATSSSPAGRRPARARLVAAAGLALLAAAPLRATPPAPPVPRPPSTSRAAAATAAGRVYLTVDEALALAFPHCKVERGTEYLTEEQRKRAAELSGNEIPSAIAHPYVARDEAGRVVGTAYFDTHRVRTLDEVLMVVVDPQGRVGRVELLAFGEPPEYVPHGAWYGQFLGRPLDDELNLKRGIRGVTGATLTARATTSAVRRVLAVHAALAEHPADRTR
jgi:FMN-binding domain